MDGVSQCPRDTAWPGHTMAWGAPSLGTAWGPVPERGEPCVARGSASSKALLSRAWWGEEGTRAVAGAPA